MFLRIALQGPGRKTTEKLFCLVMFSGGDENLNITQLEQREWLRFTETLTSDGFVRSFLFHAEA